MPDTSPTPVDLDLDAIEAISRAGMHANPEDVLALIAELRSSRATDTAHGFVLLDYGPGDTEPFQVSDWYADAEEAQADAADIAVQSQEIGHDGRQYIVCRCVPISAGYLLDPGKVPVDREALAIVINSTSDPRIPRWGLYEALDSLRAALQGQQP